MLWAGRARGELSMGSEDTGITGIMTRGDLGNTSGTTWSSPGESQSLGSDGKVEVEQFK